MTAENSTELNFLDTREMGLGAWAWGDRIFWNYGRGYTDEDIAEAANATPGNSAAFFPSYSLMEEIKDRIEEEIRVSEFKDFKEDLKKDFSLDKKDFGLDTKDTAPDASREAAGGSEVKKNGEGQEIS